MIALTRAQWFDAVDSMLTAEIEGLDRAERSGNRGKALEDALQIAHVARRVLVLDAEDFNHLALEADRSWAKPLQACAFPHEPRERNRGALRTLVPLYELMLEVIDTRAIRSEPQFLVVNAHLIAEYLCQLAWESTLGHAGDPLQIGDYVGERWGTDDPTCAHGSAMRSTATRALNAATGDTPGFTSYLDRFHSRLGDTMAVCAMNHETIRAGERPDVGPTCPNPCKWALRGSRDERRNLDARLRLALIFLDSPLVALRHHAPVGHFFGVPSMEEINNAWTRTWDKLTQQWTDKSNPLGGARRGTDGLSNEALPGLSRLVSAVAGREIKPGHLLRDIGQDLEWSLKRLTPES